MISLPNIEEHVLTTLQQSGERAAMLILGGYLDLLEQDRQQGMKEADYQQVRVELDRIGEKAQAKLAEISSKLAAEEAQLARR